MLKVQKYVSFCGILPVHMLLESFQISFHFGNQNFQSLNGVNPCRNSGMKKTTVFIIEEEAPIANLIRYHLLSHQARYVQVFPNVTECLYFMRKKSKPDFLIADLAYPEINAPVFLKSILQSFPGVKILLLSPFNDDSFATQLLQEGATDYICKSGRMEDWIHELVKNMEFLIREKSRAD